MDSFFKRFGQVLKIKKSEYASQFRDLHWIMVYETSILRKLYTFKQNMSPTCTPPSKNWNNRRLENDVGTEWLTYSNNNSGSNKLEPF